MSLRNVRIDKTLVIEEALQEHLAVCLCGMPGTGRKTAVSILLEKHPEVKPVFCSVDELEDGSALERENGSQPCWYLIRKPEDSRYPETNEGLWAFIRKMKKEDRIFLAVDGLMPKGFLEFVWNGIMGEVLPESFWFTESETYQYLKRCKSTLRYREVYYLTGGWAGCIAMLVRLQKQLRDRWTARELAQRYEVRQYIRNQILSVLPEDELRLLRERASFPRLDEELVSLLWEDPQREVEERLFTRGAMVWVPDKNCWHVQPALRMAMENYASSELCRRAIAWYEEHGYIREALECSWNLQDRSVYRKCLIRNYDRIPFLHYVNIEKEDDGPGNVELFYLRWMEAVIRQDRGRLREMRKKAEDLWEHVQNGGTDAEKQKEILLNISYTDPEISTIEWMELLEEQTEPGRPVRIYFMLGESVSYLSGIRDLSELFACGRKERGAYRRLWEERVGAENQIPYRLAEMEYDFQTDGTVGHSKLHPDLLPAAGGDASWQIRLGTMYLEYLFADDSEMKNLVQTNIRELAADLEKEEDPVCRWNAMALYYLAEARWGEKEDLMKWIRETGGEIGNEGGKTRFYLAAEVKISLYLGNYAHAEELLKVLIPWFEAGRNRRWLAESLFQRAIAEKARGETGQALKTMAESIAAANPFRYVRIYCGYGVKGLELLEEYRDWLEKNKSGPRQGKKKYKYGNVLRMPVEDWLDYIVRKAGRRKKYYLDLQEEQQNIYRVEKLTVTELMVLQYMEKGFSNAEISRKMNVKLPTVKSHVYNIYKKLGVTTRIQAVQKAKESGIL